MHSIARNLESELGPILFSDPKRQNHGMRSEIEEAISRVVSSGEYILGKEVQGFEQAFAQFTETKQAVGVASGTDALIIGLKSLGIKQGDEVITVSLTAVATVAAIDAVGAVPVLVDVDSEFYTISFKEMQKAVSPRTKAVVVVHLYGQVADIESISQFCKRNKLFLIEDCAQAHGAKFGGRSVGSLGDLGCFSFYPTKNLGGIGDGGMIVTNDSSVAERCRAIRQYGWKERYISSIPGMNSRLDELQAAILRVKLKYLEKWNHQRVAIANQYNTAITSPSITKPRTRSNTQHAFHLYVIQVNNQELTREIFLSRNIRVGIHYPVPIHLQAGYQSICKIPNALKNSEYLARRVISLPMFPELSPDEIGRVVDVCNNLSE